MSSGGEGGGDACDLAGDKSCQSGAERPWRRAHRSDATAGNQQAIDLLAQKAAVGDGRGWTPGVRLVVGFFPQIIAFFGDASRALAIGL